MRSICFISFSVFATLTIVLVLGLFDLVPIHENLRNVLGLIDVLALAIFFKTFIRVYKYTHRD